MSISLEEAGGVSLESLSEDECFALLHRASLGRVGVSMGAIPAILPVNYYAQDRMIYFRTGKGTKLAAATRHAVVAFEVDGFDVPYHHGWSVLAVGMACQVKDPLLLERVLTFPLQPWAPGVRDHFVQISPDFISGRRITFAAK